MDDKELYDILNRYAESTKNDKELALSKFKRQQKPARKVHKIDGPRVSFASAMCVVCLILCIVLPLNMPQNPQKVDPSFCSDGSYIVNSEGQNTQVLDDKFHIFAHYPNPTFPTIVPDKYFEVFTVRLSNNREEPIGAYIGYGCLDMDEGGSDFFIDINVTILSKPHCYPKHKNFDKLPNTQQWQDYQIRYAIKFNDQLQQYETSVYFADGAYNYFIDASSSEQKDVIDFLNQYYA